MRISKDPEERKNELIDTAEELFSTVGYDKTSVSDIVKKVSVAQGTFYYYFKSKEDIFMAIFTRNSEKLLLEMKEKVKEKNINAVEKLMIVIKLYIESKEDSAGSKHKIVETLHNDENTSLHHKIIVEEIVTKRSMLTSIIKQGIAEGIFHTDYPEEAAEFILTELYFVFDPEVFGFSNEEIFKKSEALADMVEKLLSVPRGTFMSKIVQLKESYSKNITNL
ncbi:MULTISPECIES: TetR/AcrR family transcriptional regulator [Clostridium]|uniref:TetR/AcrR family transcriptional regulator n=1 Tax=Clostridium TaxID=1485 RepID=UPI00082585CB|nr:MULTISPECIES: TetR/AcrR family transcriptional regulator [Clostridium]